MKHIIYLLVLIGLSACSSVNLSRYQDKYVPISYEDSERLNGVFANKEDTSRYSSTLFGRISKDVVPKLDSLQVSIHVVDEKSIKFSLTQNNYPLQVVTLHGKFKKGMFTVHKWDARMIVGPLIWFLGEERLYFGINEENNLCMFNSGGTGFAMLIAFPIMAGGGGTGIHEFKRMDN